MAQAPALETSAVVPTTTPAEAPPQPLSPRTIAAVVPTITPNTPASADSSATPAGAVGRLSGFLSGPSDMDGDGPKLSSIHAASAVALLNDEVPKRIKWITVTWSVIVLFMQMTVMLTVSYGILVRPCYDEEDCFAAQFCRTDLSLCSDCGAAYEINEDGVTYKHRFRLESDIGYYPSANYTSTAFSCPEDDPLCEVCYDSSAKKFHSRQGPAVESERLRATTRSGDIVALVFTIFVVAMTEANELSDTHLCDIWLSRNTTKEKRCHVAVVRVMLHILRFCVMPQVNFAFCFSVIVGGLDAMSVCLNGVGLLFMLELDNLVFAAFAEKKLKKKVEEIEIELNFHQREDLLRGWCLHLVLVALVCGYIILQYSTFGLIGQSLYPFSIGFCQAINLFVAHTRSRSSACCEMLIGNILFFILPNIFILLVYPDLFFLEAGDGIFAPV
jgi:hypothetical protein